MQTERTLKFYKRFPLIILKLDVRKIWYIEIFNKVRDCKSEILNK